MGPYKCPECGVWWAGVEHRCPPPPMATADTITIWPSTGTYTVRCTCPPNRGALYAGNCPIHDVQITYTAVPWSATNAVAGPQTATPRGVS